MLGPQVIVGYEIVDEKKGMFKPVTVANPYRQQTLTRNNMTYEIAFYFSQIQQADEIISDDELMPLVFQGDKLVGQGWPYLNKLLKDQ